MTAPDWRRPGVASSAEFLSALGEPRQSPSATAAGCHGLASRARNGKAEDVTIGKDDIIRFARVCEMMGSPNEQERATAALKASEQLRKWGLTWTELLTNPMHLLLTKPTLLQDLIKAAWEEKQARELKDRIDRKWLELQQRAEALRLSHDKLLLQKERDLLSRVTKRDCPLQLAEQILLTLEKEILVTVHRVKTNAA